MKKISSFYLILGLMAITVATSSCKKEQGCTDPLATNYNADAEEDDGSCTYRVATSIVLKGDITSNLTINNIDKYTLEGFVYVKSGVTVTIEEGAVIKGDKASKGTLIIERGAKIMAVGTATKPIVFTSAQPKGQRAYGDWGGIIICGKAPVNLPAGEGIIEGGTGATFGGTDAADNSGKLKYVRIEFPGIAFQPNQEINGLTLGGVGSGTELDYIQVSYSGDDSYEWFGGTVNAKHLIALRGWDDEFDTDNGFSGNVQYCFALRDPQVADQSGSNGFESDNDASGTTATPQTSAVFSNVTLCGPMKDTSVAFNSLFKRGAHIRRNSAMSIFNSVISGYPIGLIIDGSASEGNATSGSLVINNSYIVGVKTNFALASGSTWDIASWFNTMAFGNTISPTNAGLGIEGLYNLTNPSLLPASGSVLLSGAKFDNAKVNNANFDKVAFKGAFGTTNWAAGWANFDPQNTEY